MWLTDGTEAGTQLVKDIYPGANYSSPTEITHLAGTTVMFRATNDNAVGAELWVSDGTEAGTLLVADLNDTPNGEFYPEGFTTVNGRLFFTGEDPTLGGELWVVTFDATPYKTFLPMSLK